MKIIWSPLAVERMTEIADYISRDNPTAAQKWAIAVFDKIENIQEFPLMGRVVPEANRKEIRELLFKNYRIIYRVGVDHISILTIRHGKQLLPSEDIE
jgi:addiction module RelE/StbE family toxin